MINQHKSDTPKTRAKPYDRRHSDYIYRRLYTNSPLQQLMAKYLKNHENLIISFTQTDRDYIKYKVCELDPSLRATFAERYAALLEAEKLMIVAPSEKYFEEESKFRSKYDELIKLGLQVIPIFVAKLINMEPYSDWGYEGVQPNPNLRVSYTLGAPEAYHMLQSVALWLDSQQQDIEKFKEKLLAGEVVSC